MLKENGRLKPATEKEIANLKGKDFYCAKCDYKETRYKTEFGDIRCPKCLGCQMTEVLDF